MGNAVFNIPEVAACCAPTFSDLALVVVEYPLLHLVGVKGLAIAGMARDA